MGILDWIFGSAQQPAALRSPSAQSAAVPPPVRVATHTPRQDAPIELTDEFKTAIAAMDGLISPLLITGNAGTGKSTLLRHFRQQTRKNVVVVAPTGMAALNVRGVTIHSFFKFPLKLIQEKDIRINHQKCDMFKKIDMIVVDEVSMVRADLLDAIDVSLRLHRASRTPFGGVQLVLFGDVCQLPPVVKERELETYFSTHYATPFFFSAHALQRTGLTVIELQKVFRQSDPTFIDVLNRIRRAEASVDDMIVVNERCAETSSSDNRITLTTTNKVSNQINQDRLDRLPPPEFHAQALVTGEFDEDSYPTAAHLLLKKSAHIMMIKNNGAMWVNGTLGTVTGWDETSVKVSLPSGSHSVERETWEVIDYRYNKKENRIEEYVVGSFSQFPLKLAWAITIHKSQGQTFDSVAIDMNKGAFAHGQLYVALSRCRSLQGIRMITPVSLTDLCFDERVRWFIERTKTGGHVSLVAHDLPVTRQRAEYQPQAQTQRASIAASDTKGAIGRALSSNSSLTITYADYNGRESTRKITPTAWVDDDMFAAYCHLRSEERHFRVSRISSFSVE